MTLFITRLSITFCLHFNTLNHRQDQCGSHHNAANTCIILARRTGHVSVMRRHKNKVQRQRQAMTFLVKNT